MPADLGTIVDRDTRGLVDVNPQTAKCLPWLRYSIPHRSQPRSNQSSAPAILRPVVPSCSSLTCLTFDRNSALATRATCALANAAPVAPTLQPLDLRPVGLSECNRFAVATDRVHASPHGHAAATRPARTKNGRTGRHTTARQHGVATKGKRVPTRC